MEFLKNHDYSNFKDIPKPLSHSRLDKLLPEYDYNFVESLNYEEIVRMLDASLTLHLNPLVELLSAKIASLYREKTLKSLVKKYKPKDEQALLNLEKELMDKYFPN